MMKQLFESSQLFGSNAPFIEELYENYLDNPDSVSEEWRKYFDSLQNVPGKGPDVAHYPIINAFAGPSASRVRKRACPTMIRLKTSVSSER